MPSGKIKLKHGEDYYLKVLLKETTVGEIMTPDPVSIGLDENFREVPRRMRRHGIRHLPVVDRGKKLSGLITERDLFRILPPHHIEDGTWHFDEEALGAIIVGQVMTPDPFAMRPGDPLGDALAAIVAHKYGCIPVTDDQGCLQGIVTQMDILKVAAQIYQE